MQTITVGQLVTQWTSETKSHESPIDRDAVLYRRTVRVLDVRKRTARIEAWRYDGTRVRRFVKLDKLIPGARRFD